MWGIGLKRANYRVIGFHATTEENGLSIVREGFNRSHNRYDWLGTGAYFYQEAPGSAVHWAKSERHEGTTENPFIIVAEIDWDGFLDLLDVGWADVLRTTYDRLNSKAKRAFTIVQQKQKAYEPQKRALAHPLDRYVLEATIRLLRGKRVHIRAVRAVFLEGKPIFEKSHLLDRAHVQIAVRDTSLVSILPTQSGPAN